MSSRLIKKSSLGAEGVWVRPVRLANGSNSQALPDNRPMIRSQPLGQPSVPFVEQDGEPVPTDRLKRLVHDLTIQLAQDRERLLAELQPHLVRLAISIARRIVGAEIRQDRRVVQRTVRAALEELSYAAGVQVRVHPDDELLVRELFMTDQTIIGNLGEPRVMADPGVERGGCVVECDRGIIDANIPTQFVELQKSLLAYLQE